MTSEEFLHLRSTFERLVAASEVERAATLGQLAETDPAMAGELERMLAAHRQDGSVLDRPLVPPISDPVREGSQIGPYRIERQLGMGGMGMVYLATRADGSFDRRVAIKILRRDRIDHLFLSRFQQERQILGQLNHPHIAAILDAGETLDGDPYFVMEYIGGMPITKYCEANRLSTDARLDLFLQTCDAVQHAHRNLTVHRDLKPGNVLVTEAGAVKLLDFGIAKLMSPPRELPADAPPTAVMLTPEYSSPEQIRGEPITTATDVFALGILLYELITGEHPFRRNSHLPHEFMRAICDDEPPAPSSVATSHRRQLRGDLDAIALTALRKQPAWRYPSVEQLADDVRRHRRGWPILAKGNRPWYRLRKFARRHWLPMAAAALVVLSLAAGVVAATYEARRANQARAIAEVERAHAQQSQQAALAEQKVAEARTVEAETERQKQHERYQDVRNLASSLLFDLYDGVRDLAGSSTARRLIVAKAQHQLEVLSADGGNDIGLLRDLAACYDRMGELRVDPRQPNKNDAAAALDAYRKAVELRREIVGLPQALPADRRDLALSLSKLGDGEFFAGNAKQAVETYETARVMARSTPGALGAIDERRCAVILATGNNAAAMEACEEGIAALGPLVSQSPDDVKTRRLLASTQGSYANALRLSQKPADAAQHARLALESLQHLEVLAPNNAEYRRLASSAETILALSLAAAGDQGASALALQRSVEAMRVAIEIDPTDLNSALRLSLSLLALSGRMSAKGDRDGAHSAATQAIGLLRQTAENPVAGPVEWNEYANALIKTDWPDLRQTARALELAQHAVASTGRKNPFFLDTLAWACFKNGKTAEAVQDEREAISLLPADAKSALRDELNVALKTFLGDL